MALPKRLHTAFYRAHQFFTALKACLPSWAGGVQGRLSSSDKTLTETVLAAPAQRQLFARMSPNDRLHAIAVARTLQQAGHKDSALLQAALLHDVAKCLGQPIVHRVMIVLFEVFWPAALRRLSQLPAAEIRQPLPDRTSSSGPCHAALNQIPRWRRPFVIHAHHPTIGADWAEQAGCDALAVCLIRNHQNLSLSDAEDQELSNFLTALQWADNLN